MASKTGWKKLGPYRAGKKRTDPPGPVAVFLDPVSIQRFVEGHHGEIQVIEHLRKGESKYGN